MATRRTLGRGVALVGAGMSKFGAFKDRDSRDLFVEAFLAMQESVQRGFDPEEIDAIYVGNYSSDLFEGQEINRTEFTVSWVFLRSASFIEFRF